MTCRVRNRYPGRIVCNGIVCNGIVCNDDVCNDDVCNDDYGLTPRVNAMACTHTTWLVHSRRTFHSVDGPDCGGETWRHSRCLAANG